VTDLRRRAGLRVYAAPGMGDQDQSRDRVVQERDLLRALLDIVRERDLEPLLEGGLRAIVAATGAARGFLQVTQGSRAFYASMELEGEALERVRTAVSTGIIAEALATGQTVETASALLDARFAARPSVRQLKIEAVLCVPLRGEDCHGVLYLEGVTGAGPFHPESVALAERFVSTIEPFTDALLQGVPGGASDPTAPWRERLDLDGIVGCSEALARVFEQVADIARLDIGVLLVGETGTGKTRIARAIHDNSARRRGPFVEINCSLLPENLAESELFGAARGAHSTASQAVEGKVSAAEGGTLFLDEVAELHPKVQAKLLKLLQSRRYFALGSTREKEADIRVIAATNVPLEERVAQGAFREDLLYRLTIVTIPLPPLRLRREDILPLAEHVAATAADRHGLPHLRFTPRARAYLRELEWPGNVRQLANVVEVASIRAATRRADRIGRDHFAADTASGSFSSVDPDALGTWQEQTRRFQKRLLRRTLEACGGNKSQAARDLDISRQHLHELIRAHGLSDG